MYIYANYKCAFAYYIYFRRTGITITLTGSELAALKDIASTGSSSGSGCGDSGGSNNARLSNTAAPLLLLLQHPEILGEVSALFICDLSERVSV